VVLTNDARVREHAPRLGARIEQFTRRDADVAIGVVAIVSQPAVHEDSSVG